MPSPITMNLEDLRRVFKAYDTVPCGAHCLFLLDELEHERMVVRVEKCGGYKPCVWDHLLMKVKSNDD